MKLITNVKDLCEENLLNSTKGYLYFVKASKAKKIKTLSKCKFKLN